MECPQFDYGDVVRVSDDIAAVHQMQYGHGEWADDMALVSMVCTGQVCVWKNKELSTLVQ